MDSIKEMLTREVGFETHALRMSETGRCVRYRVKAALDHAPTNDAPLPWGILDFGTKWEEAMMERLLEQDDTWLTQLELNYRGILGHLDGWHEASRTLLEVKTTSMNARKYLPVEEHLLQAASYSIARVPLEFEGEYGRNTLEPITVVLLYCFREDPSQMEEFRFEAGGREWQQLCHGAVNKNESALDYRTLKVVPEIPDGYKSGSYPCTWHHRRYTVKCPYWQDCWGDEAVEEVRRDAPQVEATAVVRAYQEYQNAKKEASERQKTYKSLMDPLVVAQSDDTTSLSLPQGFSLQRRERKSVDSARLKSLGVDIPYKHVSYWQMMGGEAE